MDGKLFDFRSLAGTSANLADELDLAIGAHGDLAAAASVPVTLNTL